MKTFILAACLLVPFSAHAGPLSALQKFTVTDLNAAIADATARNDTRHLPCWQALLPWVNGLSVGVHLPTAPGFAELAQSVFDGEASLGKPLVPDAVVTACALTISDLNMTFAQLALAAGAAGVTLPKLVLP